MTAQVSNIPVAVDYTSRDFYALREDLINLVKARVNVDSSKQWSGDDSSDFGVALLEAFAYVGDLTNYYIDRIANESYLPTATQRKSILNLAKLYGYLPTGYRSAQVDVEFSNSYIAEITGVSGDGSEVTFLADNNFVIGDVVTISGVDPSSYNLVLVEVIDCDSTYFTVSSTITTPYVEGGTVGKVITIPEGAQISGSVIFSDIVEEVLFTTTQEAVIPPAVNNSFGKVSVVARHGEDISVRPENVATEEDGISGEFLGTSDGLPNQKYVLSEVEVVTDDIVLYVQSGDLYEPWQQVTNLIDYGPSDAVYSTELDENNFVSVVFGDGISGAIPNTLAGIKVSYYAGAGALGNIVPGVLTTLEYIPNFSSEELNSLSEFVSVGNPRSTGIGGAEPEDNGSIRTNASLAIRALNRVVSLQDYESLALYVNNVGKANATAAVWTSVTLYVAPVRNEGDLDKFPGFDGANDEVTPEWETIQQNVVSYFEGKTLIGSTLQVFPPTYVPVTIDVAYSKSLAYTSEQALDDVSRTILNEFSYYNLSFEQIITPEQIEATLNGLTSVSKARVTALYRTGESAKRAALIGQPSEIFVFLESNLEVLEYSDNAQLSNLTASSGTLSPTFDSDFYAYNLTGVSAAGVALTPVGDVGATITINGVSPVTDTTKKNITRFNATSTTVAVVHTTSASTAYPVGSRVVITAGTPAGTSPVNLPAYALGTWTVTEATSSTITIVGSGFTIADTTGINATETINALPGTIPVALGAVGSVTSVPIVVIAPDGTTVKVYNVAIFRSAP
jgi:hypothetical protein